ncbi:MAG: maleylpyruvate isomerase N-terminal domain-containing protein [Actinomycetes bacterium]
MSDQLDYLAHVERESARFLEAVRQTKPSARVPTCPDWNADDLLWHLAEVQWFWGTIVRDQVSGDEAEAAKPGRPAGRAELESFFVAASGDLARALAQAPDSQHAWTWASDQTVGFVRRRQAHEALIHRVDAELTAGSRSAMDSALSSDGVDEALRVMFGGLPPWGAFTPDPGRSVRLRTTDTEASWLVDLGRFTGTEPDSGTAYDEPDLRPRDVDEGSPAAATVSGSAADLDCWLWHRPTSAPLESAGDASVLRALDAILAPGLS